jgi:hypothetical protein
MNINNPGHCRVVPESMSQCLREPVLVVTIVRPGVPPSESSASGKSLRANLLAP